ncbi:MAG: phosphate ABC transporter substrate-binding protein PstS [Chloroflexi bacterium]|nr:phosphate ABC transporter substrate-binding protein PstS [Chloroflexota bacterium]
MTIRPTWKLSGLALAAVVVVGACGGGTLASQTPAAQASTPANQSAAPVGTPAQTITYRCTKGDGQLNGAGSTFIFPLLSKMGDDYNAKCGVKLNYQSIGSGGGIKAWTDNTVDFGASDAFLKDSDIAAATKGEPVEVPVTFGAVVVAYKLSGLSAPLKMTPDVIAGIFDGRITKWNDPLIAAANAGVTLPDTEVSVVHRSDGSGTTSIFTTYLTAVSPDWVTTVGGGDPAKSAGKTVEWPVGLGASGNEGVTQGINQTDGGVGYIELAYALKNSIPFADVQNKSGNFITPSLDAVKEAANLPSYPADLRFNLVNTASANGYPITGTTWLIVYKDLSKVLTNQDRAKALVDFLWWAIHEGQQDSAPLFYGTIPASLLAQDEAAVESINWNGQPLLP